MASRAVAGSLHVPEGASTANVAHWHACYTRPRHEKRVAAVLAERGLDTFLPLIAKTSQWKDREKVVEWPLFPSYVFSRFSEVDTHRVLSVPGVATLVKANGRPVIIRDEELENVRIFARALESGELETEPRPYFAEGEWVEVQDGPLRGVRGVVVEQRGRRRVIVGLKAIGAGLEVDVDAMTLVSISPP